MKGEGKCRKIDLVATIVTLMLATYAGEFGVGFARYLFAYVAATSGNLKRNTPSERTCTDRTQANNVHSLRLARSVFRQRKTIPHS